MRNRSERTPSHGDGRHLRPTPLLSPTAIIGAELRSLPPAERRVADHILRDPATASLITISELADATRSSPATIVRLARRIGFDGYREFRIALATEVGRASGREAPLTGVEIRPTDDLHALVTKVAATDIVAIRNTMDSLDMASFAAVVQALSGARRTLLVGAGAAGLVACDLRDKLYRLRKDVVAATDRHAALTGAAMLAPQDVAFGISHSGETQDVVGPIAQARETGATTIALTNYRDSTLARQARIVICTAVSDMSIRSRGTASRAAMMTLIDCIFIAVVQTDYEASLQALERTERAIARGAPRGKFQRHRDPARSSPPSGR